MYRRSVKTSPAGQQRQGVAPYMGYVDGALFLSDRGDITARIEGEYDQKITQRLIFQPSVELELAAQGIPERGIGAGLTKIEPGLRLVLTPRVHS